MMANVLIEEAHGAALVLTGDIHDLVHDAKSGKLAAAIDSLQQNCRTGGEWQVRIDALGLGLKHFDGGVVTTNGLSAYSWHGIVYQCAYLLRMMSPCESGPERQLMTIAEQGYDYGRIMLELQQEFARTSVPPNPDCDQGKYFVEELQSRYCIPEDKAAAFDQKLNRFRAKNRSRQNEAWFDVSGRGRGGRRFLYRADAIADIIRQYQ